MKVTFRVSVATGVPEPSTTLTVTPTPTASSRGDRLVKPIPYVIAVCPDGVVCCMKPVCVTTTLGGPTADVCLRRQGAEHERGRAPRTKHNSCASAHCSNVL